MTLLNRIFIVVMLATALVNLVLKVVEKGDVVTQATLAVWVAIAWFWFERAEGRR